jgi:hypothetical protein
MMIFSAQTFPARSEGISPSACRLRHNIQRWIDSRVTPQYSVFCWTRPACYIRIIIIYDACRLSSPGRTRGRSEQEIAA